MRWSLLLLFPLLLQARGGRYGACTQADALANTTVGPYGNQVSVRFQADPGGSLQAIRPFLIWSFKKPGYHRGTGGILRVEVQTDDGTPAHRPSGEVLARSAQRLYLVPASDQFFPLISFDRQPRLRPGALYHVVFSNPHPESSANFYSVNALYCKVGDRPMQPGRTDLGWALLYRNAAHPAWDLRRTSGTAESFTPILEVLYAGGATQGQGYLEVWVGAGKPIGGAAQVGEVFRVAGGPRTVAGAAVRVRRLTGNRPLELSLQDAEGQNLARASCVPDLACTAPGATGGCGWARAAFPEPVTLRPGRGYRLVLGAGAPGSFEAYPLRKGTDKGYSDATLFPDGHAEFKDGAGWQGWEQWGRKNRVDSDLQFFLDLAE